MPSQAWNVYLDGKLIDTVFYTVRADGGAIQTAEDVKKSLVEHDAYNPSIVVRKAK
jgi:hypothetical protein